MRVNVLKYNIIFLLMGCLPYGDETDFEINSEEGISSVARVMHINPSLIRDVHYHRNEVGIDNFYHAKFSVSSSDFKKHIILTDLVKDSVTYIKDKPFLSAPDWFNTPSTISSSYSKERPGLQIGICYDSLKSTAYYYYYTQ